MKTTPAHAPPDPYPVSPLNGAVVDARRVTFRWEPVDGAARYAIDVARDPEFTDVIVSHEMPASTREFKLAGSFPTDDRTLFWRVSAGNAHGWSEGERIESFIAGTAEQAGHFPDPDEVEPFGPIEAILRHPTDPGSSD